MHSFEISFPSAGNVGIGTLTPQAALELKGDILISNSNIPMGLNTEVHGFYPILNMSLNFRETGLNTDYLGVSFRIDARSPSMSLFQWLKRDPGSNVQEKVIMNLSQFGNLGIGIIQPDERLAVNRNIRAKEVRVEANNWPDYVFTENYQLDPLSSIERYIRMNGHLPDMPNAKSVEINGVSLGDLNKLLLRKIEELTLHLIEQNKKLEDLSLEVRQLRKSKK